MEKTYWFFTANSAPGHLNAMHCFTGTLSTDGCFINRDTFSKSLNEKNGTTGFWNIIFLMQITEDQFNFYNKKHE